MPIELPADEELSRMNLTELKPGMTATIVSLDETNPNVCRLADMGLVPGHEVALIRRAPLGDPLQVSVLNHELCLRKADARSVFVQCNR
jgi:ferrous iron transport protein A